MAQKTTKELGALLGLEIEVNLVGKQSNVPGRVMTGGNWQTITVHETANTSPGADARMHRQFVKNGGGSESVSFTYCVDSKRAVQILPENWVNWAQGTAEGNTTSLSIETCVNSDGDWAATKRNLARLLACLLYGRGVGISSVKQHNIWYGKDCPHNLRQGNQWGDLLMNTGVQILALKDAAGGGSGGGGGGTPPSPTARYFPETGYWVGGGFLAEWDKHGLAVMGFPISMEYAADGFVKQDFENVRLRWKTGEPVRFDAVTRELLECKGGN